jgi:CRP-like cAMP-binding protein
MTVQVAPAQYRDVAIFQDLSDEEILEILDGSRQVEVPAGAAVFREGDIGDSFYILASGKCAVRKRIDGGEGEVDLATLVPKAAFGEIGLICEKPRIASVYAVEPSVLRRISADRFQALVARGQSAVTKIALNMVRILSDRLDALNREFGKVMARTEALATAPKKGEKKKLEELQRFKEQLYREWAF